MIRLHCTKKLLSKLPLREGGYVRGTKPSLYAANDGPESPLSGWHGNLLRVQRRNCVLFVHDTTRFPVFVSSLKKDDFANLEDWFADGFMNTLLKTGADEELMQRAHAMLGPLVCDANGNRSVQGTMNQMAQEAAFMIEYDGASISDIAGYRLSAHLAERPCNVKGQKACIWPVDAMVDLLLSQGK